MVVPKTGGQVIAKSRQAGDKFSACLFQTRGSVYRCFLRNGCRRIFPHRTGVEAYIGHITDEGRTAQERYEIERDANNMARWRPIGLGKERKAAAR